MILVQILDSSPPNEGQPAVKTLRMHQVPSVGENISLSEDSVLTVRTIIWTPEYGRHDVQLRVW